MGSFRKLKACATLFLVLAASFSWASEVHAEFSVEVNRLLVFFKDVLMIDTSQCTVSVPNEHGDNSPALGTRGEKGGKITLVFNGGGSVDSLFEFKGEFLTWCLIYYGYEGSNPIPYLQTQSDNHLDLARGFLERYRVFTNDPTVDAMSEMLTTNNGAHKLPQNMGNMKMTISEDVSPDFSWSYTFEGEDYRLLSVSFFSSPHIFSFGDDRYRYNMDSSAFPRYEPESPTPKLQTAIASPNFQELVISKEHSMTTENFSEEIAVNPDLVPVATLVLIAFFVIAIAGFMKMKQKAGHNNDAKQSTYSCIQASTFIAKTTPETGRKSFE